MHYLEMFLYYGLLTALVLSAVVFIHEFGHFYAARRFGVKVEAFSIGFGREIWGKTDSKGMRWKICAFPFGGYVVFHGEDELREPNPEGAFWAKPNWQRSLISLAGPAANFLLALVLMFFVFLFDGKPVANSTINAVEIGSGADRAGLKVGDVILSVNGKAIPEDFIDLTKIINEDGSNAAAVEFMRDGQKMSRVVDLHVMKDEGDFGEDKSRRVMGVILGRGAWKIEAINAVDGVDTSGHPDFARQLIKEKLGRDVVVNFGLVKKEGDEQKDYHMHLTAENNAALSDPEHVNYSSVVYGNLKDMRKREVSVFEAFIQSSLFSWEAVRKVSGVIYQMFVGKKDTGDLGGVVKIGEMTGGAFRQSEISGYSIFFRLIAAISVNIGFLNLLPLPMLDGGRLTFNLYEAIRGKRPSHKVRAYIMAGSVGFVFAIILMTNIRDIFEIFM